MTDELERLAQRGASHQRHHEERANEAATEERELMLLNSLQSRWTEPLWIVLALAVLLLVALAYLEIGAYALFGLIPGFALLYFVARGVSRWELARQRAWLRSLPWALDHARYEALLAEQYGGFMGFVLEIELAAPVESARRPTLVAAAVGALPEAQASFIGDTLRIEGPSVRTRFGGRSGSTHSNIRLHAWFRRCVNRALWPIHAAHPIARIRVDVR